VDAQNVTWVLCAWYAWVGLKPFDPNCCVIESTNCWRHFRRRRIRLREKTDLVSYCQLFSAPRHCHVLSRSFLRRIVEKWSFRTGMETAAGFPWPHKEFPVAFMPIQAVEMDDGVGKYNRRPKRKQPARRCSSCWAVGNAMFIGYCSGNALRCTGPFDSSHVARIFANHRSSLYCSIVVDGFQGREEAAERSNDAQARLIHRMLQGFLQITGPPFIAVSS